jgi:gp16 family phage-associated protein
MESRMIRTRQDVRDDFLRKGQSIGSWADKHGFDRTTVNQVLTGRNAATRGVGHRVAILLGIKDGEIMDDDGHENT